MKRRVCLTMIVLITALTLTTVTQATAATFYVDPTGSNTTGQTWADAFWTLQQGIDAASASGGGEVWVAGGPISAPITYNELRTEAWGGPSGDPGRVTGSLVMKSNVGLYGGFEGYRGGSGLQETSRAQRNRAQNIAIIDGSTARGGNPAYHVVVFGSQVEPTVNSVLDGFTVKGGFASGIAGAYHTHRGGGIYNWGSRPTIANCTLTGNRANVSGGGIANEIAPFGAGDATVINCLMFENYAFRQADGGPGPDGGNPLRGGGAIFNNQSSPITNFNTITVNYTDPAYIGDNHGLNSAGIYTWDANPRVNNGIVWNNNPGGIRHESSMGAVNSTVVTYSDVQGGYLGTGNLNVDPQFGNVTYIGLLGLVYVPQVGSPVCEAGDPAITGGDDMLGVPRPLPAGGRADMGAYEVSTLGPAAVCQAHTVALDAACSGTMTGADIGGDSSAEAGIWKLDASQTTFDSSDMPSTNVTLTVFDTIGRKANCTATVSISDPILPVITVCPGDRLVDLDASCQAAIPDLASLVVATDNCGIAGITQAPVAGTPISVNTLVTMTVTDIGGNAVQCTAWVNVQDVTLPVIITCPPDQTLTPDPNCQVTVPDFASTGTYADNCGIGSVTQDPAAGTIVTGTTTITISVTDTSGNVATCQPTLIVSDTVNPVAVCQDITVNLSTPTINAQAIDGGSTDNCGITTWLINGNADKTLTCADMPSVVCVLTVQDAGGNSATCNATVTVVDDVPPLITMNGISPVTVECGDSYTDAGASANDNCDGPLTPSAAGTVDASTVGSYTVTYTVSDAAGNAATPVTRQVDVVDTTSPIISMNGTSPVTVECGASYTDEGATADDACVGALTPNAAGTVDTAVVGSYTVTYTISDPSGNNATPVVRQVDVVDALKPVITVLGDAVVYVAQGDPYTDAGATADDQCDGDLTGSISAVNPVDTNTPGTYFVTYDVTDAHGNAAVQVTREVIVYDTSQPDLISVAVETELTVLVTYNKVMDDPGGVMTAGNYTVSGSGMGTLNPNPGSAERITGSEYRLVWSRPDEMYDGGDITITVDPAVEDPGGNTIRINEGTDTGGAIGEAPVIALNADDETLECSIDVFTEAGATAADDVDGTVSVTITGDDLVNTAAEGVYVIGYEASDAAGNTASDSRTVTVEDTMAPGLELVGASPMYLECNVDAYSEPGASALDACAGDLTGAIVIGTPPNPSALGTQYVSYTVTDPEGYSAFTNREVTIEDTLPPSIALLGDDPILLTHGGDYVEAGAEALDECEGDLSGSVVITGEVPNTNAMAAYMLTYTASDSSDNTAYTTRTVVVEPADCDLAYNLSVSPNPAAPEAKVTFTAAALPESCGAGDIHYTWKKNGVEIPAGLDAPTYVINSAAFGDAGEYTCTVSDASSSSDTNSVTLEITSSVPAVGAGGLILAAVAAALGGVLSLRKRR